MRFYCSRLTGAYGARRNQCGWFIWENVDIPHAGHLVAFRLDGSVHHYVGGLVVPGPCEATAAPEVLTDENEDSNG